MRGWRVAVLALVAVGVPLVMYGGTIVAGAVGGDDAGDCFGPIASYAFDVGNDRLLVAFVSHVFLGRVGARVGAEGLPTPSSDAETARTQVSVAVLERVEGVLPAEVVGRYGRDGGSGETASAAGDPVTRPGDPALFVTRRDPTDGRYHVAADGFGALRARDDAAAALVAPFRRAAAGGPTDAIPIERLIATPDPAARATKDTEAPSRCAHEETERTGEYRPGPDCARPRSAG